MCTYLSNVFLKFYKRYSTTPVRLEKERRDVSKRNEESEMKKRATQINEKLKREKKRAKTTTTIRTTMTSKIKS